MQARVYAGSMIDLGPLAWMVHVAAAFAIAFFAQSVFSPKGREARVVIRAMIPVVILTLLGPGGCRTRSRAC